MDAVHEIFMKEALAMAQEAFDASEVPVGCVFVRGGVIIAKARNRTNELRNATRHAELEAIDQILAETPELSQYPLSSTTLYVTVEPCIMCGSALRQLGIKEVFFGCANDRFGGCGSVLGTNEIYHPVHPVYKAIGGYLREEAITILRRFYITENTNAPVPKSKADTQFLVQGLFHTKSEKSLPRLNFDQVVTQHHGFAVILAGYAVSFGVAFKPR